MSRTFFRPPYNDLMTLRPHTLARLASERIAGAALRHQRLFTWGDRLLAWDLPGGRPRVLAAPGGFAGTGCLMEVEGGSSLILQEAGRLVWRRTPNWEAREIAVGIDTPDLLPAVFHGRRGVLLVQKYIQVRFYQVPPDGSAHWPVRDVYSFYTPSHEAGLALDDVDGDGNPDILCGNYWIRTPERFDLPWRLYAINTYNETPWSAAARLAVADLAGRGAAGLVVAEAEIEEHARLAWFEKPADPKQLWREHRLEGDLNLRKPRGLAVADFDGDGRPDVAAGENSGGDSRLLLFHNQGAGRFRAEEIGRGAAIRNLFAMDGGLLAVGADSITWWS